MIIEGKYNRIGKYVCDNRLTGYVLSVLLGNIGDSADIEINICHDIWTLECCEDRINTCHNSTVFADFQP